SPSRCSAAWYCESANSPGNAPAGPAPDAATGDSTMGAAAIAEGRGGRGGAAAGSAGGGGAGVASAAAESGVGAGAATATWVTTAVKRPWSGTMRILSSPRRSEERRVGKECRYGWSRQQFKRKREIGLEGLGRHSGGHAESY